MNASSPFWMVVSTTLAMVAGCAVDDAPDAIGSLEQHETTSPATVSWLMRFDSRFTDQFSGLGADAAGNVYAAGYLGDASPRDSRIIKVSPSGAVIWSRTLAGTTGQPRGRTTVFDLSVGSNGDCWLRGVVTPLVESNLDPLLPRQQYFLAHVDANGSVKVATLFAEGSGIHHVAADATGGAAILGTYTTAITLPGKTLSGGSGTFVAKLDGAAQHLWSTDIRGSGLAVGALGVSAAGDIYLSGQGAHVTVGGGTIASAPSTRVPFSDNLFVAKLAGSDGHQLWGRGAVHNGVGHHGRFRGPLAVLPNGGVAVAGTYAGGARDFLVNPLPRSNGSFVASFAADGALTYARAYPEVLPPETDSYELKLAALPTGGLVLAGGAMRGQALERTLQKLSVLAPDGTLTKSWTVETSQDCRYCTYGFRWAGVATTPDGGILVGVQHAPSVTIGSRTLTPDNVGFPQEDAFLAKLAP